MIDNFNDHSANERTFLAWVRTAIAVAAFGFLVEKFDLFLDVASRSTGQQPPSRLGTMVAEIIGLFIIVLGGSMMALAAVRFRRTSVEIDSPERRRAEGVRMDLGLVTVLLLFGAMVFGYMAFSVTRHFG